MDKRSLLKDVSASDLRQELINRLMEQIRRNELETESLRSQVKQLAPEIEIANGLVMKRRSRTLAKNGQPLREVIMHVMREAGEPLRTREIIARVRSSGYQSKAANFPSMVNFALNNNESLFERIERGVYRIKPGAESTLMTSDAEAEAVALA